LREALGRLGDLPVALLTGAGAEHIADDTADYTPNVPLRRLLLDVGRSCLAPCLTPRWASWMLASAIAVMRGMASGLNSQAVMPRLYQIAPESQPARTQEEGVSPSHAILAAVSNRSASRWGL
jgi:hypothetical protein